MESHKQVPTKEEVSLKDYEIKVVPTIPEDDEIQKNTIYIGFKKTEAICKFKTNDGKINEHSIYKDELKKAIEKGEHKNLTEYKEFIDHKDSKEYQEYIKRGEQKDNLSYAVDTVFNLGPNSLTKEFGFQTIDKNLLFALIKANIEEKEKAELKANVEEKEKAETKQKPSQKLKEELSKIQELVGAKAHEKSKILVGDKVDEMSNVLVGAKQLDEVLSNEEYLKILQNNTSMQKMVKTINSMIVDNFVKTIDAEILGYFQGKDMEEISKSKNDMKEFTDKGAELSNKITYYILHDIMKEDSAILRDFTMERWIMIASELHKKNNYFGAQAIMNTLSSSKFDSFSDEEKFKRYDRLSPEGRSLFNELNNFYGSLSARNKKLAIDEIKAKPGTKIGMMFLITNIVDNLQEQIGRLESSIETAISKIKEINQNEAFDKNKKEQEINKLLSEIIENSYSYIEEEELSKVIREKYNLPSDTNPENLDFLTTVKDQDLSTGVNLLKEIQKLLREEKWKVLNKMANELISVETNINYDSILPLKKDIFQSTKWEEARDISEGNKEQDTYNKRIREEQQEIDQMIVESKDKEVKKSKKALLKCKDMYGYDKRAKEKISEKKKVSDKKKDKEKEGKKRVSDEQKEGSGKKRISAEKKVSLEGYKTEVVTSIPNDDNIQENTIYIEFKKRIEATLSPNTMTCKFKTSDGKVNTYSMDQYELKAAIGKAIDEGKHEELSEYKKFIEEKDPKGEYQEYNKRKEPLKEILLDALDNVFVDPNSLDKFGFLKIDKNLLFELIKANVEEKSNQPKKKRRQRVFSRQPEQAEHQNIGKTRRGTITIPPTSTRPTVTRGTAPVTTSTSPTMTTGTALVTTSTTPSVTMVTATTTTPTTSPIQTTPIIDKEVRKYISHCKKSHKDPLYDAVKKNNVGMVVKLLELGYDPVEKDNRTGRTSIHLAARNGNRQILIKLIGKIIDTEKDKDKVLKQAVNSKDNDGNTPLHLAVKSDNNEFIIFSLLKAGAINVQNNSKKTPLELAEEINNKKYSEILSSAGLFVINTIKDLIENRDKGHIIAIKDVDNKQIDDLKVKMESLYAVLFNHLNAAVKDPESNKLTSGEIINQWLENNKPILQKQSFFTSKGGKKSESLEAKFLQELMKDPKIEDQFQKKLNEDVNKMSAKQQEKLRIQQARLDQLEQLGSGSGKHRKK